MIRRAFKIFSVVWLTGWLLSWAWNIKGEFAHPEDYSIVLPSGESRFDTRKFMVRMLDDGWLLFLVWPVGVYIEVGVHMGWICKSAEIGRC